MEVDYTSAVVAVEELNLMACKSGWPMAVRTAMVLTAQEGHNTAVAAVYLMDWASMKETSVLVAMAASCMNSSRYCSQRLSHAGLVARPIEELDIMLDYMVDVLYLQRPRGYRQAGVGIGLLAIEIVSEQNSVGCTAPAGIVEHQEKADIDVDIQTWQSFRTNSGRENEDFEMLDLSGTAPLEACLQSSQRLGAHYCLGIYCHSSR